MPARFAQLGDPGAGIDAAAGSLNSLLELSARHKAEGQQDAPWPPNYKKMEGEPPRVQPSKRRTPPPEGKSRSFDYKETRNAGIKKQKASSWFPSFLLSLFSICFSCDSARFEDQRELRWGRLLELIVAAIKG